MKVTSPSDFIKRLVDLHQLRMKSKSKSKRGQGLSKSDRLKVFSKTSGKCHVCGDELDPVNFEADHVMAHAKGGANHVDNFLPACRTCNNYRWDYLSEEFQWILKIGVWARTQMEKETKIGRIMTEGFMVHERRRINRRK